LRLLAAVVGEISLFIVVHLNVSPVSLPERPSKQAFGILSLLSHVPWRIGTSLAAR